MECYAKIDRSYDYHGSWGIYKNVVTGQEIEVEEGKQNKYGKR